MKRTRLVAEDDPGFARFWAAYQRRVAKRNARQAWVEVAPTPAQVDQIVTALAWQFAQPDWCREDFRYAPHPATYLRAARWEDEPPPSVAEAEVDLIETWGYCLHTPTCTDSDVCRAKRQQAREET